MRKICLQENCSFSFLSNKHWRNSLKLNNWKNIGKKRFCRWKNLILSLCWRWIRWSNLSICFGEICWCVVKMVPIKWIKAWREIFPFWEAWRNFVRTSDNWRRTFSLSIVSSSSIRSWENAQFVSFSPKTGSRTSSRSIWLVEGSSSGISDKLSQGFEYLRIDFIGNELRRRSIANCFPPFVDRARMSNARFSSSLIRLIDGLIGKLFLVDVDANLASPFNGHNKDIQLSLKRLDKHFLLFFCKKINDEGFFFLLKKWRKRWIWIDEKCWYEFHLKRTNSLTLTRKIWIQTPFSPMRKKNKNIKDSRIFKYEKFQRTKHFENLQWRKELSNIFLSQKATSICFFQLFKFFYHNGKFSLNEIQLSLVDRSASIIELISWEDFLLVQRRAAHNISNGTIPISPVKLYSIVIWGERANIFIRVSLNFQL